MRTAILGGVQRDEDVDDWRDDLMGRWAAEELGKDTKRGGIKQRGGGALRIIKGGSGSDWGADYGGGFGGGGEVESVVRLGRRAGGG